MPQPIPDAPALSTTHARDGHSRLLAAITANSDKRLT